MSVAVEPSTARAPRLPPSRSGAAVDTVLLLIAPVATFFLLRVRLMAGGQVRDSWIYTGYQLHGRDLVRRFGTDPYYWVRLGATLPERVFSAAFGAVPGFLVLRWVLVVLAVVPLFWLLRPALGRAAAWAAVLAVLVSPVSWSTWGTDYPDALIASYLLGAVGLLNLPTTTRIPRVASVVVAGVLLTLSVHGQVLAAPLVAVIVLVHLLVGGRGVRSAVLTAVGLLGLAVLTTAGLMVVAHAWLGSANIFAPTLHNFHELRKPSALRLWHSTSNAWFPLIPSLLVPYLLSAAWVVVAVVRRHEMHRSERLLGWTAVVSSIVWLYLQFFGQVAALEYRLYVSMLWALVLPVWGLLLFRTVGGRGARARWAASGVLVVTALALSLVDLGGVHVRYRWAVLAGVLALLVLLTSLRRTTPLQGVAAAAVAAVLVVGLTALPSHKPTDDERFSQLPAGRYSRIFGATNNDDFLARYELADRIGRVIGPGGRGQLTLFWYAPGSLPAHLGDDLAATYVWLHMPPGFPNRTNRPLFIANAYALLPRPMVIVAASDAQARRFARLWSRSGHPLRVSRRTTLSSHGYTIHVWLARALP